MDKTILEAARNAIFWRNSEDEKYHDGRYWLSDFIETNTYLLIVKDGQIVGYIPGCYHDSGIINCTTEEWIDAIDFAIQEKINGKYRLIKVDRNGTYFSLLWRYALEH